MPKYSEYYFQLLKIYSKYECYPICKKKKPDIATITAKREITVDL